MVNSKHNNFYGVEALDVHVFSKVLPGWERRLQIPQDIECPALAKPPPLSTVGVTPGSYPPYFRRMASSSLCHFWTDGYDR